MAGLTDAMHRFFTASMDSASLNDAALSRRDIRAKVPIMCGPACAPDDERDAPALAFRGVDDYDERGVLNAV